MLISNETIMLLSLFFRSMLDSVHSFISWLNEAEHVVRFQHYFGIRPLANRQPDLIPKTEVKKNIDNSNNTATQIFNGLYNRHHERKGTYDENVLDECLQEIKHNAKEGKPQEDNPSEIDYKVTSWFWYCFFQFGSSLGNEIFYILFFPTWLV